MANKVTHWLRFLECEDEAEHTGIAFTVPDDLLTQEVLVWNTYHGYPESEDYSARWSSRTDARELWRSLVDSGRYVQEGTLSRECGEGLL